ncbi:MAG: cytochrome c family protein [Gemmataceae bacterium]|nr:cytochrome c family protein [Gemmataceae bacterium]
MSAKLILAGAGLTCLAACFWQPSALERAGAGDGKPALTYFGNSTCAECHNEEKIPPKKKVDFSMRTEMHTWYQLDKHKDAMKVLLEKRGTQIAARLGIKGKLTDGKTWNKDWDQCVSCHGVVVPPGAKLDASFEDHEERIRSGVSCVFCHGADARWVEKHATDILGTWAKSTRAEKEAKHGLVDLWDPVKRAALCSECHIGNARKGKVVTHEMYAAGHPPLPGFEILAFSEAMPRHWETWSEKLARLPKNKALYEHAYETKAEAFDGEQVRLLNVSSVVALRAAMQLVHDLARRDIDHPNAKAPAWPAPAWPELAAFDCYACHHDLKSDSWRHLRTTAGRPGRPHLRPWPKVLPASAARQAAQHGAAPLADEYHKRLKDMGDVFDQAPFGDPRAVADKAGAVVTWCDQMLSALPKDQAAGRNVLMALLNRPKGELLDFDSARQIAWGAQTLLPVVVPEAGKRAEVKVQLEALRQQLMLQLPRGQVRIAEDFLPQVLKRISTYDPRQFQQTMEALAAEVFRDR